MSRDCRYLFVWDIFATDDIAQKALTMLENIEQHIGYKLHGDGVVIDGRTLFWKCTKHGLNGPDIVFPEQVDQVFESADHDQYVDVSEHWRNRGLSGHRSP